MRWLVLWWAWAASAGAQAPSPAWWDARWPLRTAIVVDGRALSEPLTDFPVLVRFPAPPPALARALGDGGDIRFVSGDDRAELDFEVERSSRGDAAFWVRLPVFLPGDVPNRFFLYYGNPEGRLSGRGRRPEGVWASFNAVFHFSDPGQVFFDSTGRGNGLDPGRAPGRAADGFVGRVPGGAVGDAVRFAGGDAVVAPSAGSFAGMEEGGAVEAMVRPSRPGDGGTILAARSADGRRGVRFGLAGSSLCVSTAYDGAWSADLAVPGFLRDSPDAWHHAAVSFSVPGFLRRVVADADGLAVDRRLQGPLSFDATRLGRGMEDGDPARFAGDIDELRFSSLTLPEDWLRSSARNLSGEPGFVIAGTEERLGGPPAAPSAFHLVSPADGGVWRKRSVPVLRWGASVGAVSYRVALSRHADLSSPVRLPGVAVTQARVRGPRLDPKDRWWWTVYAAGPGGETRAAEAYSLRVQDWAEAGARPAAPAVRPVFERAEDASIRLGGVVGERVRGNLEHWLLTAPGRNPAMLRMIRDRDSDPPRVVMPWVGEFIGKYLVSAVGGYRLTGDRRLGRLLEKTFGELLEAQGADGYLGPFSRAARLTGANWDAWGHAHAMLALIEYHKLTGQKKYLEAASRAGDLIFETFVDEPGLLANGGHLGQMNSAVVHPLTLLHRLTGRARYLEAAESIVRWWDDPDGPGYLRGARAGLEPWEYDGRRWESLHALQGLGELSLQRGEAGLREAFERVWRGLARGDRHNTGALTTDEEFKGEPYAPGAIETCATVGWLALTVDRLRLTGDARAADELERSTLNAALGAQSPGGGSWTFDTPMDGRKRYGEELAWQAPPGGPGLNCCAVHGPRSVGMIADWAVMRAGRGLVLNYYGPSDVSVPVGDGVALRLRQETRYPADGRVRLRVSTPRPVRVALKLRIPGWSRRTAASVNGAGAGPAEAGTYLELEREWREGDVVDLEFDFGLRYEAGAREAQGKASVFRGPLLLAYDQRFNAAPPAAMSALDMGALEGRESATALKPAPWVLVAVKAADGRDVALCDFASAGSEGTEYRTWLPAARGGPSEPGTTGRP